MDPLDRHRSLFIALKRQFVKVLEKTQIPEKKFFIAIYDDPKYKSVNIKKMNQDLLIELFSSLCNDMMLYEKYYDHYLNSKIQEEVIYTSKIPTKKLTIYF